MRKTELNNIFTAKVNEYLAKGYTFHTDSFSGHQGEIAKVDLTNGEELIRILLEMENGSWDDPFHKWYQVRVGRVTEKNWNNSEWTPTIWNNELENISLEKFYVADEYGKGKKVWLMTEEEAQAAEEAKKLHTERKRRYSLNRVVNFNKGENPTLFKALLPYINRQAGCKSIKVRNIEVVQKTTRRSGTYFYRIALTKKNHSRSIIISSETIRDLRIGK